MPGAGGQGVAPSAVLVHGLGGSAASWQQLVGPLSQSVTTIAYELTSRDSLGALVTDLHARLDALEIERVALVGHSLGGAVVLSFAATHPDRVSAIVGVAAPSVTPPEQRGALAERAEAARRAGMAAIAELHVSVGLPESFRRAHPDDVAVYRSIVASGDPERYAALCRVIADLDLTGELGKIAVPVLLVQGELDAVVPPEAARVTATAIPGCEYVELEGCGHVVPFERPGELAVLVARFVGS